MAIIKTFRAFRPKAELAHQIAALPYDVYSRQEAVLETNDKPLSFLNIDRPETMFPYDYDMYAPEVYQKAHERLDEMVDKRQFIQDEREMYYLYELTMNGRIQTGIVACACIDDYLNGVIKKHENTREEKEQDRIRHIDTCGMQTGPIFLAYRHNEDISAVIADVKEIEPCLFDFISNDGIRHRGWAVKNPKQIDKIQISFSVMQDIYIADGHHRAASAVKVGLKRRKDNPEYSGNENYNYFLSVLFADNELLVMDYNRVVKDLNGLTTQDFIQKVEEKYLVVSENAEVYPAKKGEVGMYVADKWYRLNIKNDYKRVHPVDGLDVSILQNEVLSPILSIGDPRTDKRIDFVGGIRGLKELENRVKDGSGVAFSMFPTSIAELFEVADAGLLMPPKSTWFEPKLRSGLFLHQID